MSQENYIEHGCMVGESPGLDISVPATLERLTKLSGELRQAYRAGNKDKIDETEGRIAFWMKHLKMSTVESV